MSRHRRNRCKTTDAQLHLLSMLPRLRNLNSRQWPAHRGIMLNVTVNMPDKMYRVQLSCLAQMTDRDNVTMPHSAGSRYVWMLMRSQMHAEEQNSTFRPCACDRRICPEYQSITVVYTSMAPQVHDASEVRLVSDVRTNLGKLDQHVLLLVSFACHDKSERKHQHPHVCLQ